MIEDVSASLPFGLYCLTFSAEKSSSVSSSQYDLREQTLLGRSTQTSAWAIVCFESVRMVFIFAAIPSRTDSRLLDRAVKSAIFLSPRGVLVIYPAAKGL